MCKKYKALLLGSCENALSPCLPEDWALERGDIVPAYGALRDFDAVIFADKAAPDRQAVCALITYVAHGGRLLGLGRGLCHSVPELNVLFRARMAREMPRCMIDFAPQASPLTKSDAAFSARAVPAIFTPDAIAQTEVLLKFKYGELFFPAMWAHRWAQGKVACSIYGAGVADDIAAMLRAVFMWFANDTQTEVQI